MTIRLLFYRIFTDTEIAFFDETGDKMGYYNREGKKLDTRNMRYLDSGSFGAVYLSEDKIVKIYHPECIDPFEGKITLEVFDILKEIHHPNFIELLDVYSNLDLLTLFCRKFNLIYHFQIDAYTAKYYLNSVVNPLLENKDYLLDNLRDIMDLMDIFTQEKIRADDLRSGNMILTKENMIIIVITDKGHVEHKAVTIKDVSLEEVKKTVSLINDLIVGTPIDEVSSKLEFEIKPIIGRYVKEHEIIYNTFYQVFQEFSHQNVDVVGRNNMLKQPEFNSVDKIKEILTKLDDENLLANIEADNNDIKVYIGKENNLDDDVTIIKTNYHTPSEEGTIAVVGPKRMDYDRVVALLEYIKSNIEK